MSTVIWWIRKDLRIYDNQALKAALETGLAVLPVFIQDSKLLSIQAEKRISFLFSGLRILQQEIQKFGGTLVIQQGDPLEVLTRLSRQYQCSHIFCEEDFTPYARLRDNAIEKVLPLYRVGFPTIFHPHVVMKDDGSPYTVFTPYSKKWKSLPFSQPIMVNPRGKFAPLIDEENSILPDTYGYSISLAGEQIAHQILDEFLESRVEFYNEDRNRLDLPGTSQLSAHFHFGMISAREAAWMVRQRVSESNPSKNTLGAETWLNELIWRDFYTSILYHYPFVRGQAFKKNYRAIAWRNAPQELERWKFGQTGFPVVDAGMRQLLQTGWMHNRARMIVASFLVKDLLINWQEGERWFFEQLVDGDRASNNGGWQWSAGVGTDAAPYFRIFNPTTQCKNFDPAGDFIRTWVPELKGVPYAFIHQPETMPFSLQERVGCKIGKNYPLPMLDHSLSRVRTMQAYKTSKLETMESE